MRLYEKMEAKGKLKLTPPKKTRRKTNASKRIVTYEGSRGLPGTVVLQRIELLPEHICSKKIKEELVSMNQTRPKTKKLHVCAEIGTCCKIEFEQNQK